MSPCPALCACGVPRRALWPGAGIHRQEPARKGGRGPGDIPGIARDKGRHLAGDVEGSEICGKAACRQRSWGGGCQGDTGMIQGLAKKQGVAAGTDGEVRAWGP